MFDLPAYREWMERAACRDAPHPDIFFSVGNVDVATAKKMCAECPVRDLCLEDTLKYERRSIYRDGIFGGLTAVERRRLSGRHCEKCGGPIHRDAPASRVICTPCERPKKRDRRRERKNTCADCGVPVVGTWCRQCVARNAGAASAKARNERRRVAA